MNSLALFSGRVRLAAAGLCAGLLVGVELRAADPDVSVSLRGVEGNTIEVGEPFQVAVRLGSPGDSAAGISLTPTTGSWVEATSVEVVAPNGLVASPKARALLGQGERVTVLTSDQPAWGAWWFSAEAIGSLAPGDYELQAKLTIRDGSGWKGAVTSVPLALRVVAKSNDPVRLTARVLAQARGAVLDGAPQRAAELLDGVLRNDPDNIPVLVERAGLCLSGGNPVAARFCVSRAQQLDQARQGEPSLVLYQLAQRIENWLPPEATNGPEPWTQVPLNVVEPVRSKNSAAATGPAAVPASAPVVVPNVTPAPIAVTAAPLAGPAAPAVSAPPSRRGGGAAGGVIVPAKDLGDAKIAADPNGQWANAATASSQYGKTQYSAAKATGAPDVPVVGNSPDAWCPEGQNSGTDWLEVSFARPVHATEVRVRQNDKPGALAKVEAIESDGTTHVWWEGVDPYVAPATREIAWFVVRVPRTDYLVAKVKLTLNLAAVPGWKEVDAVQLVGTNE